MSKKENIQQLDLFDLEGCIRQETLIFDHPLFYVDEKSKTGHLSKLALPSGNWAFKATHEMDDLYTLTHETGISFLAVIKEGEGKSKGTYSIKGCVKNVNASKDTFFDNVNVNGVGPAGWTLRPAQRGAVYALLSHWSLSKDVATVVLPTGTGKTETMLVATLADKADKTLVIVPSIDLKEQIAEKFQRWGILRKLGVINESTPNPTVLILDRIIEDTTIDQIERADVVVSTPGLIARSEEKILDRLKLSFTHIYFDEAHHIAAKEWECLKERFNQAKIVQFTATPYRNDRKPIEGKVVYNYPLSQALEDECFSRISLISVDERHPRKKDKAIADAAMDRLLDDRENGYTRHRMMVRAKSTKAAKKLYDDYQEWFPKERIALVHSKVKGKKEIIREIKAGKYDIIVCVDMLKEGFDYPDFKIAAVHGVHKSLAVLLQFIGRFTRTQEGLGDASFVVNYAEEKMSVELENLFQEGTGWEHVIKEIADAKKEEAESLLAFLQGCKPFTSFDSPDITLNPKLVYPALSCVCYRCDSVDWVQFKDAFDVKKYALSQPYINQEENVFYFTTQKREKVKWARTKEMRDQKWDLIVMHHDTSNGMLYIGYSDKNLDMNKLVNHISGDTATLIAGDPVFRSFDSIKRLCIIHAGLFKPANHLHRYSRFSGADVTTEISKWRNGERCTKSDFVGIGFRDGFPVSIGASVKGKIWSPARCGDLKEWKRWCLEIGAMVADSTIDSNLLLKDSAQKNEITVYPDQVVLAADWAETLYNRIHKLSLELPGNKSYLLSEASLKHISFDKDKAHFSLRILEVVVAFSIVLGGEKGHYVEGLDNFTTKVTGLESDSISLKEFFEKHPPTMFLLNGCTISGCLHTYYGEFENVELPEDRIESLSWTKVDYTVESYYKSDKTRPNSIQEFMMNRLRKLGAKIVFNDDNSGESADIVAIFQDDDIVRFELVHCKYSKDKSGARLSDLYEVCGQAIVSLRYKWKPEELLKHMERRNGTGVLKEKRFYHGNKAELEEIKKALKYSDVAFEFAIAQPGVKVSALSGDMKRLLGSVYSTVVEMTETKLRCYFNEN